MKRILTTLATSLAFLTLTLSSFEAQSSEPIEPLTTKEFKNLDDEAKLQRAEVLEVRLEEISGLDVAEMDRSEKRALRKEVKGIEREMNALDGGGIYIGGGALVIIVLLVILL